MYVASYSKSRALIIGIDEYRQASPLRYAVSDASAVAQTLVEKLGFLPDDVLTLTNGAATRSAIYKSFLSFAGVGTQPNDRLLVFFAGHGFTQRAMRGEVGFLVPVDGNIKDLSTLLRWDDLTRNADLIQAKHILFVMDACYGGLAVTRSFQPGAMRFLTDMMQRVSRQVLTAGKADELVSDLGGPLPNHSVFTGHFLEALSGKAEDNQGNLTANGVISYVYQAVSSDFTSQQTPHYGYLHGDGDMIFYPLPTEDQQKATPENERLISVPAVNTGKEDQMNQQKDLKELLSERKYRIQLYDFVAQRTREALSLTGTDYFTVQGMVTDEMFLERLQRYEKAVEPMLPEMMLLGRWGEKEHLEIFRLPLQRLADRIGPTGGSTWLIEARWYPSFLLLYAGGIGAVAGDNYSAVHAALHTQTANPYGIRNGENMLIHMIQAMGTIYDGFRLFPGQSQRHNPRSDYLFKFLQPTADDALFLGSDYERSFDRWELILALEYLQLNHPAPFEENEQAFAPVGRFGWKMSDPLSSLVKEASLAGDSWAPLKAGLFGRSSTRFMELSAALSRVVARLGWH